jgi:sodium/hydrogen exchanger 8
MDSLQVQLIFVIIVMLVYVCGAKYLEESRVKIIHHSGVCLIVGSLIGSLLTFILHMEIDYDNRIFFNFVLPIIIFEAGFSMKKRNFFKNLGIISIFGVLGTLVCFIMIGWFVILMNNWGWIVDWNG